MIEYGVIVRYARGRYGLPGIAAPEFLLPGLDPSAYITGSYALFHEHFITQIPVRVTSFTSRRHGRARRISTAIGDFLFICVKEPIYAPPREGVYAGPEQALCDYFYRACRSRLSPESQVTFRNMQRLNKSLLVQLLERYPGTVRKRLTKTGLIAGLQ